jgi:hypothetical protein
LIKREHLPNGQVRVILRHRETGKISQITTDPA